MQSLSAAVSGSANTGAVAADATRVAADATREALAGEAIRAWKEARSLLFVCLGNVCRSPFAERLVLRRSAGRRLALSAGHYPVAGRRPPEPALATAQGFGVDLASHRSRVLSPSMIAEADAVFVFDDENYEAVSLEHPRAAERTHLLGALRQDGPVHIADPFGGPASLYQTVYRQIAEATAAAEER